MKTKTKVKKISDSSSTSHVSDLESSEFYIAVARIAVAQICQSVGYRGAQTSALETLTDVAVRYLQSLAKSAANSAGSTGRTQCNLLDIIRALEDLHSNVGFHGNSEPKRRLYLLSDSTILRDTMKFVCWTREIPFAKPLPRRCHTVPSKSQCFSNTSAKLNHIPRWLPDFPKIGVGGEKTVNEGEIELEKVRSIESNREISKLPEKRKKVSFKIGDGGKNESEIEFGVDFRSVCRLGKRISFQGYDESFDAKPAMKKKLEESFSRSKMIMDL